MIGPWRRPTPETAAVLRYLPQRETCACECRASYWHAPGDCDRGGIPGDPETDATVAWSRSGDRLCSGCYCNCET